MNQYETVFIANPVLSAAQMKEAVAKFRDLITKFEGEVVHEEDWGLRKMAYPIQKKSTGFYYLLEFRSNPEFINKFEIEFRRDERIMRFLTVKLDKFSIEYNEKKRARRGEVKDQPKVEE
ncbi:MAG: 30S ribosomal protein S6 [Salinivirgaceae bacterium]|nr:30S ribosomal protein S6 [Salinivirgaceae bacterium]MDD4746482.1 30S ribosomal protein S6 [Salinivirgaceae bacterium]MDY0281498.1 30S ribosomal protein S6 [Salinivirgaceae bacterium]